jgi:sec-independent protein translocase protein TatA
MGIENPVHLAFIALVALLVLGPKRLPEVARALGHGIREFRQAVSVGEDPQVQQPQAPGGSPQQAVDPAQHVRSGDAPDRGSL